MLPRTMIAGAVACFLVSGTAHAQVAVGPNSVDAPYVHVDWGYGRVHVVAPFVNLCLRAPTGCQAGAPTGFQAEPIPTPPAQSNFRPSGERPVVRAAFARSIEAGKPPLPAWAVDSRLPAAEKATSGANGSARDIARPMTEELQSPR